MGLDPSLLVHRILRPPCRTVLILTSSWYSGSFTHRNPLVVLHPRCRCPPSRRRHSLTSPSTALPAHLVVRPRNHLCGRLCVCPRSPGCWLHCCHVLTSSSSRVLTSKCTAHIPAGRDGLYTLLSAASCELFDAPPTSPKRGEG